MEPRRTVGPSQRVVVVGAGLAGLTAALHLRGAGCEVTVVEREPFAGGRAGRLDLEGFRFDTGPTVLTMPDLLEAPLTAVGEKLGDRLDLVRLDPAYHARFADGSAIDVHTDADAMEQEVREKVSAADAAGYRRLRDWLGELYRVQMATFIDANFDSPLDALSPDLARLGVLGGFGRLGPRIAKFIDDERLRRIFSFQALYAGVPPARALAAYAVIAYMDTIAGVYFPRGRDGAPGGVRALPQAYADAAVEAGVELRLGTEVTELERVGEPRDRGRQRRRAGCPPTPSSSPPTCPSCTACSGGRRGAGGRCAGRPRRSWCTSAWTARSPTSATTRSRSARPGRPPSTRSSPTAG